MFWFGQLVAHVLTLTQMLGTTDLWHWAYAVFIGMTLGQLVLLHFVAPESPSFLLSKGRTEEAFAVLKR